MGRACDQAERAKLTYAVRSLLDAGTRVAFGSDWHVAPPTPLEGIHAAVTRQTLDGLRPGGWVPEQRITVEEALRAYTRDASFASYSELETGTLERGKLADFAIIDRDLTRVAPAELNAARVMMTSAGAGVVTPTRRYRVNCHSERSEEFRPRFDNAAHGRDPPSLRSWG
jgi:predicted amidohydrolase YtcJ